MEENAAVSVELIVDGSSVVVVLGVVVAAVVKNSVVVDGVVAKVVVNFRNL